MKAGVIRAILLAAVATASAGCSADPSNPPPVQGPSPFIVQTDGLWGGTANLVSVSSLFASNLGCLGTDVAGRILSGVLPEDTVALSFTQDGTAVSARYTSGGTGLACTYTGTAALTTVVADSADCAAPAPLVVRCDTAPSVTLQRVSSSLVASFNGGNLVGTVTNAYSEVTDREAGQPSSFIVKYSVNLNRQ